MMDCIRCDRGKALLVPQRDVNGNSQIAQIQPRFPRDNFFYDQSCSTDLRNQSRSRKSSSEPAMIIRYGPWISEVDVESTRNRYEQRAQGGTDCCTCWECKNFAVLREQAYPPDVLRLFEELGVDFRKETEVHHYGRLPSELHLYRGWFHIVGQLEHGPEAWVKTEDGKWQRRFHQSSPTFEMGLHAKDNAPDCPGDFRNVHCVELDFYVQLPWSINLPEPHRVADGY